MTNGFCFKRILQALFYVQSRVYTNPSRFNKVFLLKMLFFADRYHLRHFGNIATGDEYFAMKLGPVASGTFDMLKKSSMCQAGEYLDILDQVVEISENEVEIKQQGDDELSDSFKEALDFAIREFGYFSWDKISELSHCYPEWNKFREKLDSVKRVRMELKDWFETDVELTRLQAIGKEEDPFIEDPEFLSLLKSDFNANNISF